MELNLVKEDIKIEQSLENVFTQILIEGDIIVPDINPDILEILENDSNIIIDKINISENRINYIGKLEVQVLYLAKGEVAEIHSMHSVIPIDDYVNIEGVNEQVLAEVVATIQNMDYNILNDRKISTRSIVNINVYCQKQDELSLVIDADEITTKQMKKSVVNVNKTIEKTSDRFIVKDQLFISQSSSNIKSILRKDAKIINKDYKCVNGKVYVSAEVQISVLYKSDSRDSLIDIVEKEVSFNGYIETSSAKEDMYANVELYVQELACTIKADDDGEDRVVDVEVSIYANCKVSKEEEIDILDDAYIIGQELILEKKEIKYPKLICRNKNQSTIKEIVKVTGEDVMQVFKVSANSVVEDISISEDRLICEGIINVSVLYIAQSDENPLCSYKTVLPFRQIIETRGAKDYMNKRVTTSVDHVGFNMLSDKEIELRIVVSFNAEIIEINTKNIITDIVAVELPKGQVESTPSMIIYIVQKDDKIWDIAKKYNTDLDEIIEVNEIENPDILFEGQKLLILKKVNL